MKKMLGLFAAVLLLVLGCGGGGSDTPPAPAALKVVEVYPADKATGVASNSRIQARMNLDMDPFSIVAANFEVKQGETTVPCVPPSLFDGDLINFAPVGNFAAGKVVVTMTTALKSLDGKTLAEKYSWSFTSSGSADTAAPIITMTSPVNGAAETPVDAALSFSSSKPIDPVTVWRASIKLENTDATVAVGKAILLSGKLAQTSPTTFTFKPDSDLTIKARYKVTPVGLKDMSGNEVAPVNFTFSTVAPAGSAVHYLSSAKGIFYALDGNVRATFNKNTPEVVVSQSDGKTYSNVSLKWLGIPVDAGKTYRVASSFAGFSSTPAGLKIQTQLKEDGGQYTGYASKEAVCGSSLPVLLKPTMTNLVNGRFSVNFLAVGKYKLPDVIILEVF